MAGNKNRPGWRPSRIKLIIGVSLALVLPVLLCYGINRWISYRERAFEREAIESLRELATAQEAYYGDYLAYAHDMDVLEELGPFKKNQMLLSFLLLMKMADHFIPQRSI